MSKQLRKEVGRTINRDAIIVRPAQPFLDWLHREDPSSQSLDLASLRIEPTVFLLPMSDGEDDAEFLLRKCFDVIFVEQLNGWLRDESVWPSKRTFAMFKEWFEWSYHSVLIDLGRGDLCHDDD